MAINGPFETHGWVGALFLLCRVGGLIVHAGSFEGPLKEKKKRFLRDGVIRIVE